MSISCAHLHLKGTDQETVVEAYRKQLVGRAAYVTPETDGWVTVLDSAHLGCDSDEFLGSTLCSTCQSPGVIFKVLESDVLSYWVFDDNGVVVDMADYEQEWESGEITPAQAAGLGGRPESRLEFAPSGVSLDDIVAVFEHETLSREENLWDLARLLRIQHVAGVYEGFQMYGLPEHYDGTVHVG